VLSSAVGGVIVGQVTKHAGSVKKGFALIGGILVTALAQYVAEREVSTFSKL
jgi:solute carrier family 35 (UDP-sugar transporter), member A1/2/3